MATGKLLSSLWSCLPEAGAGTFAHILWRAGVITVSLGRFKTFFSSSVPFEILLYSFELYSGCHHQSSAFLHSAWANQQCNLDRLAFPNLLGHWSTSRRRLRRLRIVIGSRLAWLHCTMSLTSMNNFRKVGSRFEFFMSSTLSRSVVIWFELLLQVNLMVAGNVFVYM